MALELLKIQNSNTANGEFVRLRATAQVNISNYAVVDRTFDAKGIPTNIYRHFFRFPNITINAGDYIRLYTGKGKYTPVKNEGGTITHKLYWGSDECIWNDDGGDAAELLYVKTIERKNAA